MKSFQYKGIRLELVHGDLTEQADVDVIVNAANTSLMGGGGVDGAIHRKGGEAILEECRAIVAKQGGCAVSEAVITTAGNLPVSHVIHTVGPVWQGGNDGEYVALERCYTNSLTLASQEGLRSIAFPSISTGIYGFPVDRACRIALKEIWGFLQHHRNLQKVTIVCFSPDVYHAYMQAFQEIDTQE